MYMKAVTQMRLEPIVVRELYKYLTVTKMCKVRRLGVETLESARLYDLMYNGVHVGDLNLGAGENIWHIMLDA